MYILLKIHLLNSTGFNQIGYSIFIIIQFFYLNFINLNHHFLLIVVINLQIFIFISIKYLLLLVQLMSFTLRFNKTIIFFLKKLFIF